MVKRPPNPVRKKRYQKAKAQGMNTSLARAVRDWTGPHYDSIMEIHKKTKVKKK